MKAISNYFHVYLLLVYCGTDSFFPLPSYLLFSLGNQNACDCLLLCPFLGIKFYPSSKRAPSLVSLIYDPATVSCF